MDTEERDVILQVLTALRSMTLHNHAVHARLKSTVATAVVDTAPVMPWVPPVPEGAGGESGSETPKRKKKKTSQTSKVVTVRRSSFILKL